MNKKFPIQDFEFHSTAIQEVDPENPDVIALAWHSTALAYLQCGQDNKMGGPAIQDPSKKGKVNLIEPFLTLKYLNEMPYMEHTFAEN